MKIHLAFKVVEYDKKYDNDKEIWIFFALAHDYLDTTLPRITGIILRNDNIIKSMDKILYHLYLSIFFIL